MATAALAAALDAAFQRYADRPAITADGRTITYRELRHEIGRVADAYRAAGIRSHDRIMTSMTNGPEYLTAAAAAWECGAVHVGVDAESTTAELSRVVEITGARLLWYEPRNEQQDCAAELRALRRAHPQMGTVLAGHGPGLPALEVPPAPPDVSGRTHFDDAAIVFISSGTTGTPKATIGFHNNLSQRWMRLGGWLQFGQDDVHLAHLPLSHGFGLMMALSALLTGGRLVTLREFSGDRALRAISAGRVTVFNGSPTHFKIILDRLRRSPSDVSALRLSVGTAAPFAPSLIEAIWNELSVDFVHMYGSSEGVGVATTDREDIRLGSVGRPPAGSTRVVAADRTELPTGEIGEIAFSRKVYPVTYWQTSPSGGPDRSEWFYSGDLGRLDEEGRLYVFGRLKHQIDRGGLKIDPVEVERALLKCPEVADAAVMGIPDPVLGETVCACVVPEGGAPVTLDGVRGRLAAELAGYKLPAALRILDSIPRTQLGKIDLERLHAKCSVLTAQR